MAPGAVERLRAELDHRDARRIFLVTGARSYVTSGARAALTRALAGRSVVRHACTEPNPTLEGALAARTAFTAAGADVVVACGGGTPMDTAKLVVAFTGAADPRAVALGRARARASHPVVAIPTTAGTGSEVTHFAVVYVDGKKHSVADQSLRPVLALVDPDLTASLPPAITATSGLDALCQAIEAHWSVRADDTSRAHSRAALARLSPHLRTAVLAPTARVRLAMVEGAHQAGLAIDRAFTTACHALSYHLTAVHGVAHGHAVALFLSPVLRFNAAVGADDAMADLAATRKTLSEIVAALGGSDAEDAALRVTRLLAEVGLPTRLADVGCATAAHRAALVDAVNLDRLANNPRRIDRAALEAIAEAVA